MSLKNVFIIFFIKEFISNCISFNPLLTYTIRFHKITFYPNMTGNYTIDQYRENQFINGYWKVDSNNMINKVIATFQRCDPEGVNCEYFQTWNVTDICKKLKENNQLWSRWYNSFDPHIECPINKLNYKIVNATTDIGTAVTWYPDSVNYRWKLRQNYYNDTIFIGGYTIEASIFGYRKRIKSIFKN